jgi:hypothetical protein
MQRVPIFDTNIFGHAQSGKIPASDWRFLLRRRPRGGWALSSVTALELLADLDDVGAERFAEFRDRIKLAFRLSNGVVHEEPRFLICRDLLNLPFPPELPHLSGELLSNYVSVIRRAPTLLRLREGVPWRGGRASWSGAPTMKKVVDGVKGEWKRQVEAFVDGIYPDWRTEVEKTGRRIPREMRKEFIPEERWTVQDSHFVQSFLQWLHAKPDPPLLAEMTERLEPVLKFTRFVVREFMIGKYSLTKNDSDVFDQFQLHYLALDGFILVSHDPDMSKRTANSAQSDRILSFEKFLQSL